MNVTDPSKKYTDGRYLFPPRAEVQIPPAGLYKCHPDQWFGQVKLDGSCATLIIDPKGTGYKLYNRHNELLTLQRPLNYGALNPFNQYMVLCGEYLNKNKRGEDGQPFNHKFIIWDMLVVDGIYLTGETNAYRQNLLEQLYPSERISVDSSGSLQNFAPYQYIQPTAVEGIYRARNIINEPFTPHYAEMVKTELYEGFVLKRTMAKLEVGYKSTNNASWQVKCRRETKNYKF